MTPLFKKLNLGSIQQVVVIGHPESFAEELLALANTGVEVSYQVEKPPVPFLLSFVKTVGEVEEAAELANTSTEGDAVVWLAYPKLSSTKYQCEFNRDTGWAALGNAGFEGVRQVAIDADWSALRFRRVEFIKSLTRDPSRAGSEVGKARTRKQGG